MKKVFVLIASAIVCMSAMAQVQFGGKVGFDMTHFWGQGVDHGMKPGYQVGLMMEYKFSSSFAIAPEVVFAAQGGKDKLFLLDIDQHGIEFVNSAGMKYNANYINVPVMLKYYATPISASISVRRLVSTCITRLLPRKLMSLSTSRTAPSLSISAWVWVPPTTSPIMPLFRHVILLV